MTGDDERAIDAITGRFFAAFDNRGGQAPGLDDLHGLFVPGGVVVKQASDTSDVMSVEAFIAPRAALLTSGRLTGFHEYETSSRTEISGTLAWRQSSYEKSGMMDGAPYRGRGTKLSSLVRTGQGWRLVSVIWEDADE